MYIINYQAQTTTHNCLMVIYVHLSLATDGLYVSKETCCNGIFAGQMSGSKLTCLMLDYVRVINFRIIIFYYYIANTARSMQTD